MYEPLPAIKRYKIGMTIKHITLEVLTCLAVVYIALIAFLNLNFHGGSITESTERLNSLILVTLLVAIGIRLVKKSSLTTVLAIVADITLIGLTIEAIVSDSLWKTLMNFVIEPGITLTLICIALLVWDWVKRIEKIKLQTGNKV
jgi:hypothetical protein